MERASSHWPAAAIARRCEAHAANEPATPESSFAKVVQFVKDGIELPGDVSGFVTTNSGASSRFNVHNTVTSKLIPPATPNDPYRGTITVTSTSVYCAGGGRLMITRRRTRPKTHRPTTDSVRSMDPTRRPTAFILSISRSSAARPTASRSPSRRSKVCNGGPMKTNAPTSWNTGTAAGAVVQARSEDGIVDRKRLPTGSAHAARSRPACPKSQCEAAE